MSHNSDYSKIILSLSTLIVGINKDNYCFSLITTTSKLIFTKIVPNLLNTAKNLNFTFLNQCAWDMQARACLVSWNCFGLHISMRMCLSVCLCIQPLKALITRGIIWCDTDHVCLIKQILQLSPAFSCFMWHLPSIKWMGIVLFSRNTFVVHWPGVLCIWIINKETLMFHGKLTVHYLKTRCS